MDEDQIELAAQFIAKGRLGPSQISILPDDLIPQNVFDGYAIQAEVNKILRMAQLGSVVGHKIGCTTNVMQKFLEIDHPCAGEIFDSTVYSSKTELPLSKFSHVGVECEIAVRIGSDMVGLEDPFTPQGVALYVSAIMAGIELVDDRYEDYKKLNAATLIGDNFFNCGVVLGDEFTNWRDLDLSSISGALKIDGVEISKGCGADILGNPFEALAWIANHRANIGAPILAGSFVMLGSVVETVFIEKSCRIDIEFNGLAPVSVIFT